MTKRTFQLVCILVFTFLRGTGFPQDFRILHYGYDEGISDPFVYTIAQDAKGFIWAGTGDGMCRFEGTAFSADVIRDSASMAVVQSSFRSSKGDLWIGFQSGDIACYDGMKTRLVDTGEEIKSTITGFAETDDGRMIFVSQSNGLYLLDPATDEITPVAGVETGLYMSLLGTGSTLLLGMPEGLVAYELISQQPEARLLFEVEELAFTRIQDIQRTADGQAYWIATEDMGLFRLSFGNGGYELIAAGVENLLPGANIQSVLEDTSGNLWLGTKNKGAFLVKSGQGGGEMTVLAQYSTDNGLVSNNVRKIYMDLEGNLWIATYGDGITLMVPKAFSIHSFESRELGNDILSVFEANDNNIYLGGYEGLYRTSSLGDNALEAVPGMPRDQITALWQHGQDLLVGTANNGLYVLDLSTSRVSKAAYESGSLGRWVNSVTGDAEHLYVGTRDGIYTLDNQYRETGHYTTLQGLPYNNVEFLYVDREQRVLFATRTDGIYQLIPDDGTIVNAYPAGESEVEFKCMAEDQNGNLWAATLGSGVFYFNGDTVMKYTEVSGLRSDYCYSLAFTSNQSLWIGHRLGVSRINTATFRVSVYDDKSIDMQGYCNQNAACIDLSGRALFGTTEGVLSYDPDSERSEKMPPVTNIIRVLINDTEYDFTREIVLPYNLYKLRIDYIGLHYSDPQTVTYQYRLEGFDLDWSEVTDLKYANYPRIEDGEYTFYLRSYSNEGMTQDVPATFTIRVKLPFWKTAWFISMVVLLLIAAVYLFIKIRERKQKQLQEYLETELAARTKEVVEQKEVIEIKNRDITDSINYAKRIQTSMLPPIKRLQQYFSGCFVFYSPRDIVSGDFYWFDRVSENKFVIVCADSTGHGVPGAFMSMIGSTLIKDICTRVNGNSPSKVLQMLDHELGNTLNQNLEDGTKPTDGMDIIVCEIDLKTSYVRYASAMRPMIVYRNGEEIFFKGSRNSIGGHYEREDNVFMDEGLQLSKGDILYMFSDGYSDQFGGPMGKKFKMVRLKNLLTEIHGKPMEEQYQMISGTFNQWKENYEQVDDVLFMGIKI